MKLIYIILLLPALLLANINAFNMTHTVKSRAVALGGAFMAVPDGLASALYNPATLDLNRFRNRPRFAFYVNPVGTASLINDYSKLDEHRDLQAIDYLHMTGYMLKGVTYTRPNFSAMLLLAEPLYANDAISDHVEPDMLSTRHLLNSTVDVLTFNLRLADQIAIGASAYMFTSLEESDDLRQEQGTSYGIFLAPYSTFSLGVCFYDIPNRMSDIFFKNSRIPDETINVGVRLQPLQPLSLSVDIRNVSEEENDIIREVHAGLEWILYQFAAVRSGYYYEKEIKTHVYSAGLGLLSNNLFHSTDNAFDTDDFIVNYGIQIRDNNKFQNYYHYLTCTIRF